MDIKKYVGTEGKLISAAKAEEFILPHQKKQREFLARGENYVKAEFFGIHTFNELIEMHGDKCVGFRVYYGIQNEPDDAGARRPTSRLVIVPVDSSGKDLTTSSQLGGLKDMPAQKEVMIGGPLCPSEC